MARRPGKCPSREASGSGLRTRKYAIIQPAKAEGRHWQQEHVMIRSIEGVFRGGKVELLEPPPTQEESRVLITFLPERKQIDLRERGIDPNQAADLRARLQAFGQD